MLATAVFRNRRDAGRRLGVALRSCAGSGDRIVLALPRGGVPVGYEVALALNAPLDLLMVRKLGVPGHEELAMGAIASGGIQVLNDEVVGPLGIAPVTIAEVAARESAELRRRDLRYRGGLPAPTVADRTVILVDDGIATGSTMLAAITALRTLNPRRIVVATPVASLEAARALRTRADTFVALATPRPFYGVGQWYEDFSQTSDQEVCDLLQAARDRTTVTTLGTDAHTPAVPI